jgi:hypothetical protein
MQIMSNALFIGSLAINPTLLCALAIYVLWPPLVITVTACVALYTPSYLVDMLVVLTANAVEP